MILEEKVVGNWDKFLRSILTEANVFCSIAKVLRLYLNKSLVIYPEQVDVFKAFRECPYEKLSVVILGQDPYHDGSATGLAFANPTSSKTLSPSLRIIKDNIARLVYKGEDFHFDSTLNSWAKQGILLLNTALTVEEHKPLSHKELWTDFTREVLIKLSDTNSGIIYCLWGKNAEQYAQYINKDSNTILTHAHPAYSIYSGKPWECDHFNLINEQLRKFNNISINW